jgi:2-polyprenyl-3-methyl-5-hydroxy-6-metoxy-1,4-benzoquinol methylase
MRKLIKVFLYIKRYLKAKFRKVDVKIPEQQVLYILEKYERIDWFLYVYKYRWTRWEFWESCLWIYDNIPRNSKILELGCGCGWNLLWLAQNGFSSLTGIDIDESALGAMEEFAVFANVKIKGVKKDMFSTEDNGEIGGGGYDVIFSLSAARLDKRFDMVSFLGDNAKILNVGGAIIIDAIDVAYNNVPNNQWHTADWGKPESERRPTEHINRFSSEDVKLAAQKASLQLIKHIKHGPSDKICMNLYMLRKGK